MFERHAGPTSDVGPDQPGVGTLLSVVARLRVALGFVCGAIVFWLAAPSRSTLLLGAVVASVGEALRIWAAGHLHKSREVTSSGPYRWCAHPLYVGSGVMGAGLAVACRSGVAAVLIALYLGVALTAAVRREEAFLRQRFGDRYDRYRRGEATRGGGTANDIAVENQARRFSFARARANHEHRAVIGLLLAVLLLALKVARNV